MTDAFGRRAATVSREELFRQVWTTPMSRLARDYGISGNGLAKICDRLKVPYPPRGYWAKKAAGKRVVQYRLPDREDGTPQSATISPTPLCTSPQSLAPWPAMIGHPWPTFRDPIWRLQPTMPALEPALCETDPQSPVPAHIGETDGKPVGTDAAPPVSLPGLLAIPRVARPGTGSEQDRTFEDAPTVPGRNRWPSAPAGERQPCQAAAMGDRSAGSLGIAAVAAGLAAKPVHSYIF